MRLRPILQKTLKPGSRIVSHRFTMGDWKPAKTDRFTAMVRLDQNRAATQFAKKANVQVKDVSDLNPELKRWCTPPAPEGKPYRLRLPKGTREAFVQGFANKVAAVLRDRGRPQALRLRAVDELHEHSVISDSTWAALAQTYDQEQMMDLVFAIGQYNLVSYALNSFGVERDDGLDNTAIPFPPAAAS